MLLLCVLGLAACGGDDGVADGTSTGSSTVPRAGTTRADAGDRPVPSGEVAAKLLLVYERDPEASRKEQNTVVTGEFECPAVPGDAEAEETCAALGKAHERLFAPSEGGMACSEQYGGPERARLHGTVDGTQVDREFGRRDGCEIATWEQLRPILDALGVPGPDRGASGELG